MPVLIRRRGPAAPLVVFSIAGCLLLIAPGSLARPAFAQTTLAPAAASPGPTAVAAALDALRPALAQVGSTLNGLRVDHWKSRNEIRGSTEDDIVSIQRDLSASLPPLMDQAQASAAPAGPLAPAFALFRNIDALYDVLLRVSETANLVAPSADAAALEAARSALEVSRGQLGDAIISAAGEQDRQVVRLRAEAAAAPRKPAVEPPTIVINDGPESAPAKHKKRKPATTHTTPQPQ